MPALVVAGVLLGAALLVVAEFLPLLHVHSSAYHGGIIKTIRTGSHHSYALIPIAVVAAVLALAARLSSPRPPRAHLLAILGLGVAALGIVLARDLPAIHSSGIIQRGGSSYIASSTAAVGLYLETLGAVVLIMSGGSGMLMAPRRRRRSAS